MLLCYNGDMDIRTWIKENSEPSYGDFTRRICKTAYPVNGIRIPILRAKARELVKESGLKALNDLSDESYEEIMLQSFVLGYAKVPLSEKRALIKAYLQKCDDWSQTDSFVSTFRLSKNETEDYWNMLKDWMGDTNLCRQYPYLQRFILVFMSMKFLDDEHIDAVLAYCRTLADAPLTVKMANGWLLATASISFYDKVNAILTDLDSQTLRIYKGKMRDSFRISEEKKQEVKAL